jgi:hypothetical protein
VQPLPALAPPEPVIHAIWDWTPAGSIPAVAIVSVFTNDYLGQVVVPLLTFPETSIATEARASG